LIVVDYFQKKSQKLIFFEPFNIIIIEYPLKINKL